MLRLSVTLLLLGCGTDQDYQQGNVKKKQCAIIMLKAEQCYADYPNNDVMTWRSCEMLDHEYRHCELESFYKFNQKGSEE